MNISEMMPMISIVFLALIATVQCLTRDAPWNIKLTTADQAKSYEGPVEILAVFKDGKQHAITLASVRYLPGQTSTFKIGLISDGPIQMIYIRTHGQCSSGIKPLNNLRIQSIELQSIDTNTTYTKYVDDLAVKDACQNGKSLGSALKDLDEFNPNFCSVDGKRYENGQEFELDCTARCKCDQGVYGCVDMCPPQAWSPDSKCHFVHVPGQCCDVVRCEDDEKMTTCTEQVGKEADVDSDKPPVRRYPWTVVICVDEQCSQVYGGAIIGSRHILTFAPDLSTFADLRFIAGQYIAGPNGSDFSPLRITNISAHEDFVNSESPIADSGSRLQLLQIDQMFVFDKEIQAANLPFNNQQCTELSKNGCPLMTVGWDRTDMDDAEIRQWFLHAEKTESSQTACIAQSHPKIPGPKRRGDRRVCINGLSRSDCTGPLGGTVVSTRGSVDILLGLLDPDSALFACTKKGTASMLPICKYADWIQSITTADNF